MPDPEPENTSNCDNAPGLPDPEPENTSNCDNAPDSPDPEPENTGNYDNTPDLPDPGDGFRTELPVNMTLENIVDLTGEMEHLNELVMISLDKAGGFTCTEAYFTVVQPILDLLEVEIRVRYKPGMSKNEMKLIVQDWIDSEIRELQ
jgi:hypothetical protein